MAELWQMSATKLAALIRDRQVSVREVIETHLRRIEAVNPLINAVTVVLGEQALQTAKAADGAVAGGEELPPFHGVPFTVKENIDLAGTATTQGAKALADAYPSRDAPVVERLKAAGAIPIGRTNLPAYGVGWVGDHRAAVGGDERPVDALQYPASSSGVADRDWSARRISSWGRTKRAMAEDRMPINQAAISPVRSLRVMQGVTAGAGSAFREAAVHVLAAPGARSALDRA